MPNKKFTPNNNNNRLVGPPRGKSLDGQAPTYSTMQIKTLKLLANVNSVNENDDNNKVTVSNNVPPLVIIILGCSITTILHLIVHKHESLPLTTLLALHRLHLLLLHPMLLLKTKELHIYGATI